jgi:antitoxin component YwqK of YwqJK toxin-antitoxin module
MKWIAATALTALILSACERIQVRQEAYPDGSAKSREGIVVRHGQAVRQGLRTTWYPGGQRESVEAYSDGYLQGYVLRWHPNGRLRSVEHYTDGERDGQAKYWDEDGSLAACYDAKHRDCLMESGGREGIAQLVARP